METAEPIAQSFVTTIAKSDLTKVSLDMIEVAVDSILENGVLKDIPVIGSIVGLYKGFIGIREVIFIKKVATFLSALSDIPAQEREDMFVKLEKDGKKRQDVGEAVLLILDQVDDYQKARLLGVLLKSLSKSLLDYVTFKRFSSIINSGFIEDIKSLPMFRNEHDSPAALYLQSQGLVYTNNMWFGEGIPQLNYTITPMGALLCDVLEIN